MSYTHSGKVPEPGRYIPASEREAAAKFAYFRKAEAAINGGPAPAAKPRFGASKCGTNGGYMRHYRLKEERCAACKAAHSRAELERQRMSKSRIINATTPSNNNAVRDTPTLVTELRPPEIELVAQGQIKTARQLLPTTVIRA